MSPSRNLVAVLTPPGRAAIAVLGLRGPDAWPVICKLFERRGRERHGKDSTLPLPETPLPGKFWLGWLGDRSANQADEVVLVVRDVEPLPHLEIHCHGGRAIVDLLVESLQAHGAQVVAWPEFERQRRPAWQVAAQEVLANAPTVRTASIALDQFQGAFARAVESIGQALDAGDFPRARSALSKLARFRNVGRHLVKPWRVVLAGAPNVGKSSLSNALAGFARSVVSPTPGTTRDVVTTAIALDGWPIELADTAGIRGGEDELESAGIDRAHAAVAEADLCLWLVDGSALPVFPDHRVDNMLLVINKCDLAAGWSWEQAPEALRVSAKSGEGLAELSATIVQKLVPEPPAPGEAVPFTEAMCAALEMHEQPSEAELSACRRALES